MLKRILIFFLFLQFIEPGNLFCNKAEIAKTEKVERKIEIYSGYVYRHNVSYMKNMGYKGHITRLEAKQLVESAYRFSNFLFSPEDILAQSKRESHFYPRARNRFGARGSGQVVHRKWRWNKQYRSIIRSHKDLFCPIKSTKAQVFIMSWFQVRTGDREETYERYSGRAIDYYKDIRKIKKEFLSMVFIE